MLGSPGVHDPQRDHLALAGGLPGWEKPSVLTQLRHAFGPSLMIENDVDAAALAERAHGHGRDVDSFAFVSIGTGIGMGLCPRWTAAPRSPRRGRRDRVHAARHRRAASTSATPAAAAAWRPPARRRALSGPPDGAALEVRSRPATYSTPRPAERRGRWRVVADEALLIARAVCAVITVVDPELVVLGGGVGQAAGFLEAVAQHLRRLAPVLPELRVSALGADAVVDGCLAAGIERAWQIVTDRIPTAIPTQRGPTGAPKHGG